MDVVIDRANAIHGALDFGNAGKEGEDGAVFLVKRLADCGGDLIFQTLAGFVAEIACLHRPGAAEAFDDGRCEECLRQVSGQGRRHQDDAEVVADDALCVEGEGEAFVGVQRTLVEFVEDNAGDAFESGIGQDHPAEHAFSDDFDARVFRGAHVEAGAQADGLADALAER